MKHSRKVCKIGAPSTVSAWGNGFTQRAGAVLGAPNAVETIFAKISGKIQKVGPDRRRAVARVIFQGYGSRGRSPHR